MAAASVEETPDPTAVLVSVTLQSGASLRARVPLQGVVGAFTVGLNSDGRIMVNPPAPLWSAAGSLPAGWSVVNSAALPALTKRRPR